MFGDVDGQNFGENNLVKDVRDLKHLRMSGAETFRNVWD